MNCVKYKSIYVMLNQKNDGWEKGAEDDKLDMCQSELPLLCREYEI